MYEIMIAPKGPACGASRQGNYYIEGNTIFFNNIMEHYCDNAGYKTFGTFKAKINKNSITIEKNKLFNQVTFKKTNEKLEISNADFVKSFYDAIGTGFEVEKEKEN